MAMNRRDAIKLVATASAVLWTPVEVASARSKATAALSQATAGVPFQPEFFSADEHDTVRLLVDLIIPADDRSGSATAAGVPEFMDFMMLDRPDMQETFRELIEEIGGTPMGNMPSREDGYGILAGGRTIHELGVTRMGHDPRSSVLDANCQAHDVRNLFVADGGPFVTNGDKNPTWTILALSMRTSEHIVQQRNQGAI